MVPKKNPKADLESKRSLFFQIGLILAFGGTLAAFEWSTHETVKNTLAYTGTETVSEELPPIVRMEQKVPELPKMKVVDLINVVDDKVNIDDDGPVIISEDFGQAVDLSKLTDIGEGDGEGSDEALPFVTLETKPEFPGGMEGLMRYVASEIRYPVICAETDIQGTVYIDFVIDKTGKVINAKLTRGVHPALDKEALRVIAGMPDWKPGKQREKPVKVAFTIPVRFKLQ